MKDPKQLVGGRISCEFMRNRSFSLVGMPFRAIYGAVVDVIMAGRRHWGICSSFDAIHADYLGNTSVTRTPGAYMDQRDLPGNT